jgi:16S rRNA (cytidine1402-2'-O)-methyltransferase
MAEAAVSLRGNCRIVGTPIGNLGDITPRAVQALREADIIFAEDTRTAKALLSYLKISKTVESCHKDNEEKAAEKILKRLSEGKRTALISEAGMPGISDPGMLLIKQLIKASVPFEIIPGACAAVNALLASGLSESGQFLFYGFLPHKGAKNALMKLKDIPFPIVFYESRHRVAKTLELLLEVFPPPVAVCRELTKLYEEIIRIRSREEIANINLKGEFTLVVNNQFKKDKKNEAPCVLPPETLANLLKEKGVAGKDITAILKQLGVKRNTAYRSAL